MQVKWDGSAKQELRLVARECRRMFGNRVAERFLSRIEKDESHLASYPRIGKVEPQLASDDDPLTYRSLVVHKHYKLVYLVEGEVIRIVKFWDTRRNPLDLIGSLR